MQERYGIRGRPQREALWMKWVGQYYYRLKRVLFAALGRLKAS